MSDQPGSEEKKGRKISRTTNAGKTAGENQGDTQRRSGSRRRGGQRRSRSSSDSATKEAQSSSGSTQGQNDSAQPKDQRSKSGQQQAGRQKHETNSQEENRINQGRPGNRRRQGYRARRSQGEGQTERDRANQASEKSAAPQTGEARQKSITQPGGENRPQGTNRRKRRGRRSSQGERSQPEIQPEKSAQDAERGSKARKTGRRRRPDRNDQNQTSRRDTAKQADGSSQAGKPASSTSRSKRGSRRPSINRRSPRRIFSPGRDSESSDIETVSRSPGTYVSLLHQSTQRPAPSIPIPTDRGIKARSQRGVFSQNWWARRWIESMEQLVDPARLQRGRSYARIGQVLSINENQHGIEARVQGSRPAPYKVLIQVTPLTDNQWNLVIDAMSEQALFTAQLLAGEMPEDIEEAFQTAGVSLYPDRPGDLFTSCSCPDWANPCKHVAATHYILGDRFDDDPFLLFRMRGRSQEQILTELNKRRGSPAETEEQIIEAEEVETIDQPIPEDLLDHFWEPAESLDTFPLTIKPPSIDMPLMTRLGEPAFLPGLSLLNILRPVYQSFTYSALRAAYSEDEPVESNPAEANPNPKEPLIGSSDP